MYQKYAPFSQQTIHATARDLDSMFEPNPQDDWSDQTPTNYSPKRANKPRNWSDQTLSDTAPNYANNHKYQRDIPEHKLDKIRSHADSNLKYDDYDTDELIAETDFHRVQVGPVECAKSITDSQIVDFLLKKYRLDRRQIITAIKSQNTREEKLQLMHDFYLQHEKTHCFSNGKHDINSQYYIFVKWNNHAVQPTLAELSDYFELYIYK